jgi:hypothetical protein
MDNSTLQRRRKQHCSVQRSSARPFTPAFEREVQVTLPGSENRPSQLASYHLSNPRFEPEIRPVQVQIRHKREGRNSSIDEMSRNKLRAENEELRVKVRSLGLELRSARETISQLQASLPLSSGSTTCSDPPRAFRPLPLLDIKKLAQCKGFQEEFMENFANFSQSWRAQLP